MRRAGVATIGRSLSEDLAGHWLSPPIRSSHCRPLGKHLSQGGRSVRWRRTHQSFDAKRDRGSVRMGRLRSEARGLIINSRRLSGAPAPRVW